MCVRPSGVYYAGIIFSIIRTGKHKALAMLAQQVNFWRNLESFNSV